MNNNLKYEQQHNKHQPTAVTKELDSKNEKVILYYTLAFIIPYSNQPGPVNINWEPVPLYTNLDRGLGQGPGARASGEGWEIQTPDREFPQNDIDGIIFFCRYVGRILKLPQKHLQSLYHHYLTYLTANYCCTCIKIIIAKEISICPCYFEESWCKVERVAPEIPS